MKTLLFSWLLLVSLGASAWCDMLPPHPRPPRTIITVANLAAFPGFKFTYSKDDGKPVPLQETQSFFSGGFLVVNLFVEDGSGERFQWASAPSSKSTALSIIDVRRDGKKIKVRYKTKPDPASEGKSAREGVSPAVSFMLSGFSLGAVVLLMRKKRATSAGR